MFGLHVLETLLHSSAFSQQDPGEKSGSGSLMFLSAGAWCSSLVGNRFIRLLAKQPFSFSLYLLDCSLHIVLKISSETRVHRGTWGPELDLALQEGSSCDGIRRTLDVSHMPNPFENCRKAPPTVTSTFLLGTELACCSLET